MTANFSYHAPTVSWARADCDHQIVRWWRDPKRVGITVFAPGEPKRPLNYCITECKKCRKKLYGLWDAWGRLKANFGTIEPKEKVKK